MLIVRIILLIVVILLMYLCLEIFVWLRVMLFVGWNKGFFVIISENINLCLLYGVVWVVIWLCGRVLWEVIIVCLIFFSDLIVVKDI